MICPHLKAWCPSCSLPQTWVCDCTSLLALWHQPSPVFAALAEPSHCQGCFRGRKVCSSVWCIQASAAKTWGWMEVPGHSLYCCRWWGGHRPVGALHHHTSPAQGILLPWQSCSLVTPHLERRRTQTHFQGPQGCGVRDWQPQWHLGTASAGKNFALPSSPKACSCLKQRDGAAAGLGPVVTPSWQHAEGCALHTHKPQCQPWLQLLLTRGTCVQTCVQHL